MGNLTSLNGIKNANTIYPGQKLKYKSGGATKSAPKVRTYVVKKNENLSSIAKKLGVSVSYLVSKNGLKNGGNLIYPGEKLRY